MIDQLAIMNSIYGRNPLIVLSLLATLCGTTSARAQKAYDIIHYQATVYGSVTTLELADGYLLASKVIMRSKFGNQVFSPSADEPDARGDLHFEPVKSTGRYKNNKGSWLTLKQLNVAQYPSRILAVYWDGKVQKTFVFKKL